MEVTQAFGAVIARIRLDAGFSQEELADVCGVHRTYISQIERGLKSPTLKVIFRLGSSLKTPPSEILCEVEKRARVT
jgi:transcriptional regulator with XRE-family HTH domain